MIEPALSTTTPRPEEDVTTTLYRAAIGPVSSGYYLPVFTRFEAADHAGISWNTAASLLTLNWLVFRKLWVAALAYVGILVAVALLVFGIGHLVFQFSDTLMMTLSVGFGLAAFVLPGLFGNALFHTECRKAMAKALTSHTNVADARDALLRQASSRNRLIALGAVNAMVVLVIALAYQQFSALSHVAVMPHGALEGGNVAIGRTTDTTSPARMVPSAPVSTVASGVSEVAASAPALAASMAASTAVSTAAGPEARASASPPSSALAASQAQASSSMPTMVIPSASANASATTLAASKAIAPVPAASAAPPVSAPPPQKAADTGTSKAKPKSQASSPKTSAPASAPAVQVRGAKEPNKKKASEKPLAAVADKSFFINVGLFGIPENAAKAHAKLLEAGLPSVMKELKAKTRQIRVRVGPYSSQAQADAAAQKIKALQLEASIVQL